MLLTFLVAATLISEKVLAYLNHSQKMVLFTERRYINLREYQPGIDTVEIPQTKTVQESDGLVQKEYRQNRLSRFYPALQPLSAPDATLVFLGGSTAVCIFMEEENRFPYLVGNLLEKKTGKKVTSINSGVPSGNNTLHSLDILLNKVIPFKPDVVVMMETINDLIVLIYDRTYWNLNLKRARRPIVEFSFYKNLKGLRGSYHPSEGHAFMDLHAAIRVLSHKIFRSGKDPDDEFARERRRKSCTWPKWWMNLK